MAKVIGPLFSFRVSGAFGEIVFDKRGIVRPKGVYRDRKTTNQGNFRQALTVAQKCVKICGPTTRQQVKNVTPWQARWNCHLMKALLGPNRANYSRYIDNFSNPAVDQLAWEQVAMRLGLHPVNLNYANEAGIWPGLQLFILASALFDMGIYVALGQPAVNAEAWAERIGS